MTESGTPFITLIALWAITSAFESWIYRVGRIDLPSRVVFGAGGLLIIFPELTTSLIGASLLVAVIAFNLLMQRRRGDANA